MSSTLDGAGQIKMAALEDAQMQLARVHSIVEHLAAAVRNANNTSSFRMQLQRAATPLAGLLKPQFGMISAQITAMILISSRSGAEPMKVRALRESVAQVRMQLEIAVTKVKERHAVAAPSARSTES